MEQEPHQREANWRPSEEEMDKVRCQLINRFKEEANKKPVNRSLGLDFKNVYTGE
jgi:hypothetical protein